MLNKHTSSTNMPHLQTRFPYKFAYTANLPSTTNMPTTTNRTSATNIPSATNMPSNDKRKTSYATTCSTSTSFESLRKQILFLVAMLCHIKATPPINQGS